jgi:hypothetical protein
MTCSAGGVLQMALGEVSRIGTTVLARFGARDLAFRRAAHGHFGRLTSAGALMSRSAGVVRRPPATMKRS